MNVIIILIVIIIIQTIVFSVITFKQNKVNNEIKNVIYKPHGVIDRLKVLESYINDHGGMYEDFRISLDRQAKVIHDLRRYIETIDRRTDHMIPNQNDELGAYVEVTKPVKFTEDVIMEKYLEVAGHVEESYDIKDIEDINIQINTKNNKTTGLLTILLYNGNVIAKPLNNEQEINKALNKYKF